MSTHFSLLFYDVLAGYSPYIYREKGRTALLGCQFNYLRRPHLLIIIIYQLISLSPGSDRCELDFTAARIKSLFTGRVE
jgi:hypothetical protein